MISDKSPPRMRIAHQDGVINVNVTVIFIVMVTAALMTLTAVLHVSAVSRSMDTPAGAASG